jgi:hypothetical protein
MVVTVIQLHFQAAARVASLVELAFARPPRKLFSKTDQNWIKKAHFLKTVLAGLPFGNQKRTQKHYSDAG